MFQKAKHHLIELGLKDNEVDVYLACFQKPIGLFVHEINDITGLKRSTIDLILQRLRKKNFISRYKQGLRWVYCAEHPDKITHDIEESLKEFANIIPALFKTVELGHTPNVRFYEGIKGVQNIYNDILITNKRLMKRDHELCIISSGRDLIKLLPNHSRDFVKKRIRNGIPVRMIAPQNIISEKIYPTSKTQLRQTVFFDEEKYPFQTEFNIYGDKIALINFSEPGVMGTVIDSPMISLSMRSLFNMLWSRGT